MGCRMRLLIAATALFGAACGVAHAADGPSKPLDFTVRSEAPAVATGLKSQKWDASKGRWGVTLHLQEPDARPSTLNDIQAGAYYKITPSLHVGGAVALGEQTPTPGPTKIGQDPSQPRVRIEGGFSF